MIQGSVSLDDENEGNCTEVLEGFHKHVATYVNWRQENNIDRRNGYIEGWEDKRDYPKAIADQIGCKWKKYPCKAGTVRISNPLLPHGSTGPANSVRRTMLPWYVLVKEDGDSMEVPDMGSYRDLAAAHQALRAGPTSPSGHRNMFGGVPYAFPADIVPEFTSWISKAVHCQARYDSYPVIAEMDELLNRMSTDELLERIKKVRADNVAMVKRHWKLVQEAEQRAYKEDMSLGIPNRSFFSNRGKHPAHNKGWEKWDGQQTREGALSRMFEGINIKSGNLEDWDVAQVDTSSSDDSGNRVPPTPSKGKGRATGSGQGATSGGGSKRYETRAASAAKSRKT